MLANTLKTTALAALLGLGAAATGGTAASAYTIRTRCENGDCVRLQCNNYGYDCFRIGYTERDYNRPYSYMTRSYTYTPETYTPDYTEGYYRDNDQDYNASPNPPPADNDQDYNASPYPPAPADYDSNYPD